MKSFTINSSNFSDLSGFFDEVENVLTDKTSGFGRNFDALNDVLRGGFGKYDFDESIELIWKGSKKSRRDLDFPQTVIYLAEWLKRAQQDSKDGVRDALETAKNQTGPTLFDIILEIIWDNKNVKLKLE
jgi:RNAse (barnase) inhibitor barstar